MVKPGDYNQYLEVYTPTSTVGADGNPTITWAKSASIWASLIPMSVREQVAMGRTIGQTTYNGKTWYSTLVTLESRLKKTNGKYLSIVSLVNVEESNEELEFIAEEINA